MHTRSSLLLPLAWSVSLLSGVKADCESYGIDFVNNGNVSQTSDCHTADYTDLMFSTLSTRLPTLLLPRSQNSLVSNSGSRRLEYTLTTNTGCADDVAAIELVNWDNGDEYECSSIPLLPDGTPETSTCDIEKDQMVSGVWGLILVSNNGDDPDSPPFANQRTFTLDVGPQATATVRILRLDFAIHQC
jgi:hypothetical protein